MIDNKELTAVSKVIKSKKLSEFVGKFSKNFYGGKNVKKFEKNLQNYFRVKHAITVNSWTSGLICCVGATGVKPGDEAIVTSWTMSATVISLLHWNVIPVFVDIDQNTFNIDPKKIEKKINSRTKLIVVADIFGNPANYKEILKIAKKNKLKVISDAAQAPGVKYNNKFAGTMADIGGISLNYHKHIQTGEGGVVFTNNNELAEKVKMLRNHGENIVSSKNDKFLNNMLGFNFRMNEIEAAIGIEQLKKLKKILKKKQSLSIKLSKNLKNLKGLKIPVTKNFNNHAFYIYPLVLDTNIIKTNRSKILKILRNKFKKKIFIEGYQNIHQLKIFKKKKCYGNTNFPWSLNKSINYSYAHGTLPVAEKLHDKTFIGILMCKYDLNNKDIDKILNAFKQTWKKISLSKG